MRTAKMKKSHEWYEQRFKSVYGKPATTLELIQFKKSYYIPDWGEVAPSSTSIAGKPKRKYNKFNP